MVGGSGGAAGRPKILLAKPTAARLDASGGSSSTVTPPGVVKLMRDREDETALRTRLPHGSFHLLSESWEIFPDRLLPILTDNTDFTVIGIIGAQGVGKSTILNELYGFDGSSSGTLPPFAVQSEETKATARHCSVGIEIRVSMERMILLDTQPIFSASVLTELMRPDGSSAVSVLVGETLSAELAHEVMGLQLGVFLASVCNVLLLVTEGLHDISLWRLMLTVEMLKQGIPDPSLLGTSGNHGLQSHSHLASTPAEKDEDSSQEDSSEFFADTLFIHTRLSEYECSWYNIKGLEKALTLYFPPPAYRRISAVQYIPPQFVYKDNENLSAKVLSGSEYKDDDSSHTRKVLQNEVLDDHDMTNLPSSDAEKQTVESAVSPGVSYFVLPLKSSDNSVKLQHESYTSMLRQLRDQILSMPRRPFARPVTERDWLRNSARTWDLVKRSSVLIDYSRTLQNSGLYRR